MLLFPCVNRQLFGNSGATATWWSDDIRSDVVAACLSAPKQPRSSSSFLPHRQTSTQILVLCFDFVIKTMFLIVDEQISFVFRHNDSQMMAPFTFGLVSQALLSLCNPVYHLGWKLLSSSVFTSPFQTTWINKNMLFLVCGFKVATPTKQYLYVFSQ